MILTILLVITSIVTFTLSRFFRDKHQAYLKENESVSRFEKKNYLATSNILKYSSFATLTLGSILGGSSTFKSISTDGGFENVLIDKPYIWGHEGVRAIPATPGRTWVWISTDNVAVNIQPVLHKEIFDDMTTSDNNYVDFESSVNTSIQKGKSPIIYEKFGLDYYNKNVRQEFRNLVRDYISKYTMTDLSIRSDVTVKIQRYVQNDLENYVKINKIPVDVKEVNFGKILPNENVLVELNNTAVQLQRVKTEQNKATAEESRKIAEKKRAEADRAYQDALNLSTDQYLQLKSLETIEAAAKSGATIFLNTPNNVSVPIKR